MKTVNYVAYCYEAMTTRGFFSESEALNQAEEWNKKFTSERPAYVVSWDDFVEMSIAQDVDPSEMLM